MTRLSLVTRGYRTGQATADVRRTVIFNGIREIVQLNWSYNGQLVKSAIWDTVSVRGWQLGDGSNGGQE